MGIFKVVRGERVFGCWEGERDIGTIGDIFLGRLAWRTSCEREMASWWPYGILVAVLRDIFGGRDVFLEGKLPKQR